MTRFQIIIGRTEDIEFIDVESKVPAKIDTGAYRSSIHCSKVKLLKKEDGTEVLRATLFGHPCAPEEKEIEFSTFSKVVVTNSFGKTEERYVVNMKIKLGPKVFSSSFTLANRSNTLMPVLIGRKLLKNRFVVDVAKNSLHNRQELKKLFGGRLLVDEEDFEE